MEPIPPAGPTASAFPCEAVELCRALYRELDGMLDMAALMALSKDAKMLRAARELTYRLRLTREAADKCVLLDPKTGLASYAAVMDDIDRRFASRSGRPYALCMSDVNDFRRHNARHGHFATDEAMATTARIMMETARSETVIGRFASGADETIWVMPGATLDEAVEAVERVHAAVARHPFPKEPLSLTSGVTVVYCTDPGPMDALRRINAALLVGKRHSKGAVIAHSDYIDTLASQLANS